MPVVRKKTAARRKAHGADALRGDGSPRGLESESTSRARGVRIGPRGASAPRPNRFSSRLRFGILGGTFNPIHDGHIRLAKEAAKKFKLDKVIFIPTGIPPHKPKDKLLERNLRFSLVKKSIEKYPHFVASPIEIKRPGYSFAVDTMAVLKKKFGKKTNLFYIMGMDSINELLTWRQPFRLFDYCEFIVASRPSSSRRIFRRMMKFPPLKRNADKIHLFELKMPHSSTDIRARLKAGKSIEGLVPAPVLKHLQTNGVHV